MFHSCTHHDDGFCGFAFHGLVCHGKTGDLRIGGQILVDTVEPHRIIVKVETQLLAHGGEFAGFAAEHGYQLLRGHRFDSTTAFLEFSEYEIELGIRFLQIRHVLFASAGFHQLVDDLAPFDAALVLADHHAGAVRILGGLLGVRHQSFGELFVGILQVDEFDHGNVGKQRWADGFIEGILVGRCGVELDEFGVGSRLQRLCAQCLGARVVQIRVASGHHGYRYVRCCFRHAPISPHRLDNDLPA